MSEFGRSFGSFVEAIDRATSVDELRSTFLCAMAQAGFEHVALFTCATLQDRSQQAINFARIPQAWLDRYSDCRYFEIDPVFDAVRRQLAPFSWNDPAYRQGLTDPQRAMLAESDEAGLVGGLAIPIWGPDMPPACCSLVPGREDVEPLSYSRGHSLAVFAYARAYQTMGQPSRPPSVALAKRERECLLLAARGKSDWAIGEMLGISERTVHHAIERAKSRYGVGTRVQAIVRAIAAGEFSATDAMG